MKRAAYVLVLMLSGALAAAGSLRDPTRPPHAAAPVHATAPSMPVVSAILMRSGVDGLRSVKAIVDGRWVRAGDEVSGGRVRAITADHVSWERHGKVLELRVANSNPTIKKPAGSPQGGKGAS